MQRLGGACGRSPSVAMIRMAGEQAGRAVELFGERRCGRGRAAASAPESATPRRRRLLDAVGEAVGAADHEGDVAARSSRQRASRSASARVVQAAPRSSSATTRAPAGRRRAMRTASAASNCATGLPRSRGSGLSSTSSNAKSARQPPRVVVDGRRRPRPASGGRARPGAASCPPCARRTGARQAGDAARSAFVRRRGRLGRGPQFLEVVVGANRGLHDVDDDVAERRPAPIRRVSSPSTPMIVRAGRLELVADVARERLRLARGFGGGDDERVEEAGELARHRAPRCRGP